MSEFDFSGRNFAILACGVAASVLGFNKWQDSYNTAQELRGRVESDAFHDVGYAVFDSPHIINGMVFDVKSTIPQWEIEARDSIPMGTLSAAGAGVAVGAALKILGIKPSFRSKRK